MTTRRSIHHGNRKRGGCLKWFVGIVLILLLLVGVVLAKIYLDANKISNAVYMEKTEEQSIIRKEEIKINEAEPMSILILGIDTGEEGRTDNGRSDVIMVVTLNPTNQKTTITSIPRDTLTEIVGYGTEDKINHAYAFGGTAMAINTIQALLDIPIDYSVTIDMKGFGEVIDAIDGISIVPTQTFEQSGFIFNEGVETLMNGEMALAYTRNRYDTGGDYSRQERQRQLIQAIAQKILSLNLVTQYQDILGILNGNVKIDMPFNVMLDVVQKYRNALLNIETLQLVGVGEMIDDVYYERLDEAELAQIKKRLKQELEIK